MILNHKNWDIYSKLRNKWDEIKGEFQVFKVVWDTNKSLQIIRENEFFLSSSALPKSTEINSTLAYSDLVTQTRASNSEVTTKHFISIMKAQSHQHLMSAVKWKSKWLCGLWCSESTLSYQSGSPSLSQLREFLEEIHIFRLVRIRTGIILLVSTYYILYY